MPTFIHSNPLNVCMVQREGYRLKVLLWIMEEFFHISHSLTDTDHDGRVILCYELMIEVEHRFRIKRGGSTGCRCPSIAISWQLLPHAPQISLKTLPGIILIAKHWSTWCGQSMMEFCHQGPTPKLMGPESYNQVTRRLANKVFRGLQVCCPTRTLAQFDEPPPVRVRSVVFATPPSGMPKRPEATEAMDTTPHKVNIAEEGAVGGETDVDPNTHLMMWMRNRQNSYSDEMISFWPLLHPLMDGGGTATRHLVHHLLSTWQWSSTTRTASCPPAPSNMEIG